MAKAVDGDRANCLLENLYWADTQASVSPEDFIETYLESSSLAEVADRLGIGYQTAAATAKRWRDRGVPLPKMGRGQATAEEIAALAELVRHRQKED